ncbi:MAG: type II toxin-antitoxin system HicB family antitoxin [candidate division WOR-3 bacterium]|nr:type II toxin-antitoxin system HicB family antitoxin [candidate division WOR-3 bacterium]
MTRRRKGRIGKDITYVYWQEDGAWLGYLARHPDYMTQGKSLAELRENLRDIYNSLTAFQRN